MDIFEKLLKGIPVRDDDPERAILAEQFYKAERLTAELNLKYRTMGEITEMLDKETVFSVDSTAYIKQPIYFDLFRHFSVGKNVFINSNCTMLDQGGIFIEDYVMIGPNVTLVTTNHPLDPNDRTVLLNRPIRLKRNCWIGADVTILPGVTVGENSVVGAGSVVTKDIPDNCVYAGNPAKFIKNIE